MSSSAIDIVGIGENSLAIHVVYCHGG